MKLGRGMPWSKGLLLLLLVFGLQCVALSAVAEEKITGQVKAVSRKAQTIQIQAGDGSQMVKFNEDTEGMEFIKVGEAAIIEYEKVGADRIARVIKPRLVKLPEGTSEVTNDEIAGLVALGPDQGNYFLVDSRPPARYAEGHIPTAVSIPVPQLEKTGAELLPADKDRLLIFYCGGPT